MSDLDFAIVVPVFNSADLILQTLYSVFDNGILYPNVYVVDDGSTDGTSDLIASKFGSIRIIRTINQGVSAARNRGIEETCGKYIVFLDADDLLVGDKIQRQIRIAEETGADVVYGNWQKLIQDPEGNWIEGEKVERCLSANPDIDLFTNFWCPTGAYLFRRSIVEKVGGFRLDLPVIQDARFALDCALIGAKFVHDPEISCLYRVHKSGSVSTRSQLKFSLDCLLNAEQVADFYQARGVFEGDRKKAVGWVADYHGKQLFGLDRKAFQRTVSLFQKTFPESGKCLSFAMRILCRLFGYSSACQFRFFFNKLFKGRKVGANASGLVI